MVATLYPDEIKKTITVQLSEHNRNNEQSMEFLLTVEATIYLFLDHLNRVTPTTFEFKKKSFFYTPDEAT